MTLAPQELSSDASHRAVRSRPVRGLIAPRLEHYLEGAAGRGAAARHLKPELTGREVCQIPPVPAAPRSAHACPSSARPLLHASPAARRGVEAAGSVALGGRSHPAIPAARRAARHPLGSRAAPAKPCPPSAAGELAGCSRRLLCRRAAASPHRSRPRPQSDLPCAPHRMPRVSPVPRPPVSLIRESSLGSSLCTHAVSAALPRHALPLVTSPQQGTLPPAPIDAAVARDVARLARCTAHLPVGRDPDGRRDRATAEESIARGPRVNSYLQCQ